MKILNEMNEEDKLWYGSTATISLILIIGLCLGWWHL